MKLLRFLDGTFFMIWLMIRSRWRRLCGKPDLFTQYVDKSEVKEWAELSRKK